MTLKWISAEEGSYEALYNRAYDNFGLDVAHGVRLHANGNFGFSAIEDKVNTEELRCIALFYRLRELGDLSDQVAYDRAVAIIEQVFYAKRTVLSAFQSGLALANAQARQVDPGAAPQVLDTELDLGLGSWTVRFRWLPPDTTDTQKLLLYMLDRAMEAKYRRHGDWCYEPIMIDGKATNAWRPVIDIEKWIYFETDKETHWEQWQWLTSSGGNARTVKDYLTNCIDYSFPELRKDRTVFAFSNGVYCAREDRLHPHGSVPQDVVACKFFDADCNAFDGVPALDIATPFIESILDYQGFAPDVKRWMYIMLGRLLYDLGDLDGWQVIPFLKGMASSGKSTLALHVAKRFYEDIDTGTLSNNVEKKFGLSAFCDKMLFVAPEIKNDLQIEQAEFQSMVSGEDITINVKNKTAYSKRWRTPGILAGNEVPAWCDNSGSIQRRIVLFDFCKQVVNGDMKLGEKLLLEIPTIIVKANRAYRDAARLWGMTNIWTVLPQYFLHTRDEMAQATNVLEAFLASNDVTRGHNKFCPFEDFKTALKMFAQQNNYARTGRFTWEFFRGPLDKFGIKKVRDTREYHDRRLTRDYLEGIDIDTAQTENVLG